MLERPFERLERRNHREPERFVAPVIESGQEPRKLQRAGSFEQFRQLQKLFARRAGLFREPPLRQHEWIPAAPVPGWSAADRTGPGPRVARPPGSAASASRRTSIGDALSRATRRSAACRSAAASLDGGAARATETACACHVKVAAAKRAHERRDPGSQATPSHASWPSRAARSNGPLSAARSAVAARRSWIAGFSANWTSFCCKSSRAASVRFVAARCSWKNPASAPPHSG